MHPILLAPFPSVPHTVCVPAACWGVLFASLHDGATYHAEGTDLGGENGTSGDLTTLDTEGNCRGEGCGNQVSLLALTVHTHTHTHTHTRGEHPSPQLETCFPHGTVDAFLRVRWPRPARVAQITHSAMINGCTRPPRPPPSLSSQETCVACREPCQSTLRNKNADIPQLSPRPPRKGAASQSGRPDLHTGLADPHPR